MNSFSDIGKIQAMEELYGLSAYRPVPAAAFDASDKARITLAARLFVEGIDFNLVYFPLKHLGYKCVVAVTGELYAALAHPKTLSVTLGLSAKLDFDRVKELWMGITVAAKEHGYETLQLDLQPSGNGLYISLSAVGETSRLTFQRRPQATSMDLVCVSGPLGAAYLGLQVLEKGRREFEKSGKQPDMAPYKMLIGDYLRPELEASLVSRLEEVEIYPSYAYCVSRGLSDALKRLERDSGLGVKVYADKIPFEGNSFQTGKELDIDPLSAAFNGGDDFRVLVVIPRAYFEKFRREFQTFDVIGHLAQKEVGAVMVTPEGVEFPVKAQGWL